MAVVRRGSADLFCRSAAFQIVRKAPPLLQPCSQAQSYSLGLRFSARPGRSEKPQTQKAGLRYRLMI